MKRSVAALILSLLVCTSARAQEDDGVYGRFDHGLVFALGGGAGVTTNGDVRAEGELRLRFLDTAGPILALSGAPSLQMIVVAGVELRPLFPALFLLDAWSGKWWLDTFIQSVGIELAAAFFPGAGGTAFSYGFSVELPLVRSRPGAFDGMGLRLGVRRITPSRAFEPAPPDQAGQFSVMATLTLHLGVRFPASFSDPPGYRPR